MQKFAIFVKKKLKIHMLNIKKGCKVWDYCHYTYEVLHIAYVL